VVLLGEYLGTITFTRSERFSDEEIGQLEYMLVGLVHPIRNACLYREALRVASHDPLTGVNNRVTLDRVLDHEVELAKRHNTPFSVIMLDIDRFKSVNDSYGHVVGDYTIKSLASCIVSCTRDSDIVFRYGGEEFIIVLSNTPLAGALLLAERIRETIERTVIKFDDIELRVTASLGVASINSDRSRSLLLDKVDRALYASKKRGRNCVTAAPD
jgi:diguanylate cyclase (GGDEF)-like protein